MPGQEVRARRELAHGGGGGDEVLHVAHVRHQLPAVLLKVRVGLRDAHPEAGSGAAVQLQHCLHLKVHCRKRRDAPFSETLARESFQLPNGRESPTYSTTRIRMGSGVGTAAVLRSHGLEALSHSWSGELMDG